MIGEMIIADELVESFSNNNAERKVIQIIISIYKMNGNKCKNAVGYYLLGNINSER
jgi:hypothetical protein